MKSLRLYSILGVASCLAAVPSAQGQSTPYIGFAYPAGCQRGATVQVRLGGQRIDGLRGAYVTGTGVSARLVEYRRKLSNQEMSLIREQLREWRRKPKKGARKKDAETLEMMARIEKRIAEWVNRPACAALASIAIVEVTVAPDAEPGPREIRLIAGRGVTNPLVFYVGQVPEVARKPMITATFQVLGKEALAQRKRPPEEVEDRVTIPCTLNGQIASGEVNQYRFQARKGQRLVFTVSARELIPYIADAVPGWFQPVLSLYDADGTEVAFNDDFRFKPDPTMFYEVPRDGEYVLAITDAIYRGREDFVYRVTVSELPFITSIFPLGGRVGSTVQVDPAGWNLAKTRLTLPPKDAEPGTYTITAKKGRSVSNGVPFALDTLPECFDEESNNDPAHAQKVKLPIIVNGRIDRVDDWDVFQVEGHAGETIVAEVFARRLDSPMDSMLKLTNAGGKVLAFNDDHEDPGSGLNTHHADSYLMFKLPADGKYFVHLGDTARHGGPEYAYRLRIGPPRPDFALRVVPSSATFRSRSSANLTVHAIRKDGFAGAIKLRLKNPPKGFSASPVTLAGTKDLVRMRVKTKLTATQDPVRLTVEGVAKIEDHDVVHRAVPAEDRMQAFLWRHLVPAQELAGLVYNPSYQPPLKRVHPPAPAKKPASVATKTGKAAAPKFTKRQVASRLRQLKLLYEEYLISDAFYDRKVAECEAVQ